MSALHPLTTGVGGFAPARMTPRLDSMAFEEDEGAALVSLGRRVLVVDDEPDVAELLELTFGSSGYDVRVAHGGAEALEVATRFRPHLVVLDAMMPGMDGFELCRALRADLLTSCTSIIMLTALAGVQDVIRGLRAGADDYQRKPFDLDELLVRAEVALRRGQQLRSASPLTGLPGNSEIRHRLERLVNEPGRGFALMHIDLDNFKAYNDHYGFLRGDNAIVATADLLQSLIEDFNEPAFLGHIGGDDFAVITSTPAVEGLAEAVVRRYDEMAPELYEPLEGERGYIVVKDRQGNMQRYCLLGVSIGIATTLRRRFTSAAEVVAVATEMKELAKVERGSAWRVDRRTG